MDLPALVERLVSGRASVDPEGRLAFRTVAPPHGAAKIRRIYSWLAGEALPPMWDDVRVGSEEQAAPTRSADRIRIGLPRQSGWCSSLLVPLLALVTRRRLLVVGAPGRGKTTVATLMGMLAGIPAHEIRRSVQHGHPQLTVADLLGSPLPGGLVEARETDEVKVAWRRWLRHPVKIVDEYNRIPTKTQSALLSLLAEGYGECYEQVIEVPPAAWFLTANDDLGGGTFPVIEALRDRIDAVVRCQPLDRDALARLVARLEGPTSPGPEVPPELVLDPGEIDRIDALVRALPFPEELADLLASFSTQLDFCQRASQRPEGMSKETLHLSGRSLAQVCTEECPLDKSANPCSWTEGGLSARALEATVHFAKALAWFLGAPRVDLGILAAVLPWTLHDRLRPVPQHPHLMTPEGGHLATDRAAWISHVFELARRRFEATLVSRAEIRRLEVEADRAVRSRTPGALETSLAAIEQALSRIVGAGELTGDVHAQAIRLLRTYTRCRNALTDVERLEV